MHICFSKLLLHECKDQNDSSNNFLLDPSRHTSGGQQVGHCEKPGTWGEMILLSSGYYHSPSHWKNARNQNYTPTSHRYFLNTEWDTVGYKKITKTKTSFCNRCLFSKAFTSSRRKTHRILKREFTFVCRFTFFLQWHYGTWNYGALPSSGHIAGLFTLIGNDVHSWCPGEKVQDPSQEGKCSQEQLVSQGVSPGGLPFPPGGGWNTRVDPPAMPSSFPTNCMYYFWIYFYKYYGFWTFLFKLSHL